MPFLPIFALPTFTFHPMGRPDRVLVHATRVLSYSWVLPLAAGCSGPLLWIGSAAQPWASFRVSLARTFSRWCRSRPSSPHLLFLSQLTKFRKAPNPQAPPWGSHTPIVSPTTRLHCAQLSGGRPALGARAPRRVHRHSSCQRQSHACSAHHLSPKRVGKLQGPAVGPCCNGLVGRLTGMCLSTSVPKPLPRALLRASSILHRASRGVFAILSPRPRFRATSDLHSTPHFLALSHRTRVSRTSDP